jgi:iron complex outermembrane receptor protein
MDTPFNVTSYTSKTVEDQQATSLSGVMNNNPSVRPIFSQGSYTDIFYIRGFSVFSDDTALGGVYGVLPREFVSTDIADRVEILNGPSALLNGISPLGSIGGSINIVPKRATDDSITRVTTSYNSVSNFGTHLDFGRRYGANKEWGVRFNGTIRGGDTAIDGQSQRFGDAVLGLDYRGDQLRVSADLGYQRGKYDSPTQPIYLATGVKVPKAPDLSKNTFAPWSYWDSTNYFGVVRAEYDITPNWTAFASVGARNNKYDVTATQPTITGADGTMTNTPYLFPARFESRTAQAGIRGTFDTGPINHSVSATASWLGLETGTNLFLASSAISTDLYNPVWGALPSFPGANNSRPRVSSSNLSGIALADTLSMLDERVQLTLGLRQQYVSTRNYDRATQAVTASYDEHALSPAAGLVVKPLDNLSLYTNYIEGLQAGSTAPSTATNAGETFAPYKSRQFEAGVKYDWGQVTTTFSAFQIEQPSAFTDPTTLIYSVSGQQRNRGLEFNAFGEVAKGIRVLGGVTLMDAVLTKTSSSTTQGNQAVGVPHVQVNLGGEWDTPFIEGLTLTGRVIYTSSQYYDQANTQKLPDWTRFDLGARYTFERENGKPVTIRADVLNVAGKDYWAQASNYGLALGTPRTFLLSATFDF